MSYDTWKTSPPEWYNDPEPEELVCPICETGTLSAGEMYCSVSCEMQDTGEACTVEPEGAA